MILFTAFNPDFFNDHKTCLDNENKSVNLWLILL